MADRYTTMALMPRRRLEPASRNLPRMRMTASWLGPQGRRIQGCGGSFRHIMQVPLRSLTSIHRSVHLPAQQKGVKMCEDDLDKKPHTRWPTGRMRALWCNVCYSQQAFLAETKSPHPPYRAPSPIASQRERGIGGAQEEGIAADSRHPKRAAAVVKPILPLRRVSKLPGSGWRLPGPRSNTLHYPRSHRWIVRASMP